MSVDTASAVALCRRAIEAAALLPGRRAYAILARREELRGDPIAAHATAVPGQRLCWWWQHAWLVAEGAAETVDADGPGRALHLAEAASRIRTCSVIEAGAECPPLPLLLAQAAFEERPPGASHWGGHLPGARITLPRRVRWQRRSGPGWRIDAVVAHPGDRAEVLADELVDGPLEFGADSGTASERSPWPALEASPYRDLVAEAVGLLQHGALRKVVLARAVDQRSAAPIDVSAVLERLHRDADAWTYVYACDIDAASTFVGATPELLFHTRGHDLHTAALAGSRPRGSDPVTDEDLAAELQASTKERKEHQLVVEHLVSRLAPRCRRFDVPGTPSVRRLARLQHLETQLAGDLEHPDPFDLLGALHPTPAVAGLPADAARDWIRRHEGLHRGWYTGAMGYVHPQGSRFVVPLRGGIVRGADARLFAGAGIVETSDPDAEHAETELKLEPMRRALGSG